MQTHNSFDINLSPQKHEIRVDLHPGSEYRAMPTFDLYSHRTGILLEEDLTITQIQRMLLENKDWELHPSSVVIPK